MKSKCLTGLTGLLLAAIAAGPAFADGGKEFSGIQKKKGDPSPSAAASKIDDYTRQDEQINIDGNRDAVIKVLRCNQKVLVNDFIVRVFPIRNASPIEIRNAFRNVTAAEGGRCEVIRDKKKKEYFLFVLAPKFQMPHIEAALQALDEPWVEDNVDGSADAYYQAKFRDVDKITDIALVPASAEKDARDDNLITVDAVANAVHITGEPYRVKSFVKYAKRVDRPVPQVLIETIVYEVEVSNEKRIGLDYIAWKNGPGRNLFEFIAWGTNFRQAVDTASSVLDPFLPARTTGSGTYDGKSRGRRCLFEYLLTSGYLDFLEGSGRARVVTRGKVLIRNGETGSLSATDEILFLRSSPNEDNTPVNGIVPTLVQIEGSDGTVETPVHNRTLTRDHALQIGFVMDVTPYIGQETTELHITLNLNNIVGQSSSGLPQIRTHKITTTALVQDGTPLCIGGLRRTEDIRQTQKLPILGDLPLLGWLFGHEATAKRDTEMFVVIIPKIRLGAESDLELARSEDNVIRRQVERQTRLLLPKTEAGFDRWLLDKTR